MISLHHLLLSSVINTTHKDKNSKDIWHREQTTCLFFFLLINSILIFLDHPSRPWFSDLNYSIKEMRTTQHHSHSPILEVCVNPLCFWINAIICLPELSAATEWNPHMKRLAQQEAFQSLLVDCCAKSQLLCRLYTVVQCTVSSITTVQVVSLSCRWLTASVSG